jgi:hypothetical protein
VLFYIILGDTLDKWRPGSGANPEELGSYHEGDLLTIKNSSNTVYIWDHAIVPYVISGNFSKYLLLVYFIFF